MVDDEVVAVFPSRLKDGDVRLVYCPRRGVYELWYAVSMRSRSGGGRGLVWSALSYGGASDLAREWAKGLRNVGNVLWIGVGRGCRRV